MDFSAVFKKGRRFKTDLFLFVYWHTPFAPNQLGLVTSKKRLRTSVRRHLVRRIVKESFRLHQSQFQYYHIIVVANAPANEVTREELHECCKTFWQYLATRSKRDASR